MGPAQPWQYKMGETTLFCLYQPCPHAVRRSFCSRNCCSVPALMQGHPREKNLLLPPLAMHAHPTKLTPQSRVMGDFLQTPVLCSKLGLRRRRKSSNSNLHPNPKSADWGLLDLALHTVLYLKITDTHNRHDYWAAERERKSNTSSEQH